MQPEEEYWARVSLGCFEASVTGEESSVKAKSGLRSGHSSQSEEGEETSGNKHLHIIVWNSKETRDPMTFAVWLREVKYPQPGMVQNSASGV